MSSQKEKELQKLIDDNPIVKSHVKKHSLIFGIIPNQRQVATSKMNKILIKQKERDKKVKRMSPLGSSMMIKNE